MRLPAALTALLLTTLGGVAGAADATSDTWLRVGAEVWLPRLGGDVSYRGQAATGDALSASDLGLDSTTAAGALEASVKLPFLFDVYAGYSQYNHDGSAVLGHDAGFGDNVYRSGDRVDGQALIADGYAELSFAPIDFDLAGVGIGVALHRVHGRIALADDTRGFADRLDRTFVLPALAVRGHINPIGSFTLEGRLHVNDIDFHGGRSSYVSAALEAGWRIIPLVGIVGGYRFDRYDLERDDAGQIRVNLTLSGPYLGAFAAF
jgi:hypothetical protein